MTHAAMLEKLEADSTTLNTVAYAVAKALGKVTGGADYVCDPESDVRELIDAWSTAAVTLDMATGLIDSMRSASHSSFVGQSPALLAEWDRGIAAIRDGSSRYGSSRYGGVQPSVADVEKLDREFQALLPTVWAARDLVERLGPVGERSLLRPLADAVAGLDTPASLSRLDFERKPTATRAVSAAGTSGQVFEGGDEGTGPGEDLRASQGAETSEPVTYAEAIRMLAAGTGPLQYASPSLLQDNQVLREVRVKRWNKIEKLRGKLYHASIGAKNLRKLLKAERALVKRLTTLVEILESAEPDGEEFDAAEHAIMERWPELAANRVYVQHLAETALDAAWSVFHKRPNAVTLTTRRVVVHGVEFEIAPATATPAELHAACIHPGWEYATTEGPRKAWTDGNVPPEGDGWERNVDRHGGFERFDYHEESYWRRPGALSGLSMTPNIGPIVDAR